MKHAAMAACVAAFLFLTTVACHAGGKGDATTNAVSSTGLLRFTENKGQWDAPVIYRADVPGGALFLEKNGFTYALANMEDVRQIHPPKHPIPPQGLTVRMHALKIHFEDALQPAAITSIDPETYYTNYFLGNDPSKWAGNVKSYREVTYKQLYEGIDARIYSIENSLKYDLIVRAGWSTSMLRIKYDGADKLNLVNGNLEINTSIGKMVEPKPYAYQMINGKKVDVDCQYSLAGNIISFEFPHGYMVSNELIIDPNLVFSTLTGSTSDNWGFTATYDDQGNFYTGGIANDVGYPVTAGAYQTTFGGGGCGGQPTVCYAYDISITKYNSTGTTRIYSTYLGGSDNEQPNSFVVDKNGELFVLGRTYSTDYPVTAGAFQTTNHGGGDIVLTHFNAAGTALIGSTYIGGTGDDGVNINSDFYTMNSLKFSYGDDARSDLFLDANDNVYVADCSQSTDFPVQNAFQPTFGGGGQDGVVFSINSVLTALNWSSFLGGSGADGAYSIVLDNAGSVLVAGGTESSNFPATAGAYKSSFQGTIDGFVAKIANNGSGILKCTYLGTAQYDQAYFVQVDNNDNIYILGNTMGAYPVTAGVYSNAGSSQFIHKLDSNLSTTIYSTIFGNGTLIPNLSLTAFLVDICGNVYVSGWSRDGLSYVGGSYPFANISGMPITANAYQTTTATGNGFYFMQLSRDAVSLQYGSYFGGAVGSEEHVDGGTSRFDKNNGTVYQSVCADCGGAQNFPTTAGVVSTTNNSFNCNNGSVKMQFPFNMTKAVFAATPNDSGCAPFPAVFTNNSVLATSYWWKFGDGDTSTATAPTHIYVTPGTYAVQLIAYNPTTCNQYDTTYTTVTVFPPITAVAIPDTSICNGSAAILNASGNAALTYLWSPPTGLSNATIFNPVANPSNTTTYIVNLTDTNHCQTSDTLTVVVNPLPQINVSPPAAICSGASAAISASGGATYLWSPAGSLNDPNVANPIASPAITTTYVVTVSDTNRCSGQDSVTITVNQSPVVTISPDTTICLGSSVQITSGGGLNYLWSPAAGLSDPTISNPVATPSASTTYSLTVTNANGCFNTAAVAITVNQYVGLTISPNAAICAGGQTQLNASAPNASGYAWNPPLGLSNTTIANPIANPTTTTTYSVLVTNPAGCNGIATVTVTVNPLPTVGVSPNTAICVGDHIQITASGGSAYQWLPPTGLNNSTVYNPLASPAATTIYTVNVTTAVGCIGSGTTTVTVNPLPVINVSPDSTICSGTSTQIIASSATGTGYGWIPPTGLNNVGIADPVATPSTTTTYTVIVTDANGCMTKGTTMIVVAPTPKADAGPDLDICIGESAQLNASGGYIFSWLPSPWLSSLTVPDPVVEKPLNTGSYIVIVSDGNSCPSSSDTVTVVVHPIPPVYVSTDTTIIAGTAVTITASGAGISYEWSPPLGLSCFACSNPVALPLQTTTYTVTTVDAFGCRNQDTVTIFVEDILTLYIPSAFTPNDFTIKNEVFYAYGIGIYEFEFYIFDRWGNKVFESTNQQVGWDGSFRGKMAPEDVYVYLAKATSITGKSITKTGSVTLIR